MGNPYGRLVILPLTNQSGGSVAAGDVVYLDTAHNDAFITGTTANYTGAIGVAQATIGAGSVGLVLVSGYAALVNVNASVTRGHYGATFTVAKQATDAGASRAAGTFCQFLTGGATPDAMIWQPDLGGAGMANPMTTTGDIITSSSGSTPARIAAVASGKVLISAGTSTEPAWGFMPQHGVKCYMSTTQTMNGSGTLSGWTTWTFDSEEYDTDGYHDNITNNTRITIPTGLGGVYVVSFFAYCAPLSVGTLVDLQYDGANGTLHGIRIMSTSTSTQSINGTFIVNLAAGHYIECKLNNPNAGTFNIGHASAAEVQTSFSAMLLGI